jgi:hypothetical protein
MSKIALRSIIIIVLAAVAIIPLLSMFVNAYAAAQDNWQSTGTHDKPAKKQQ